MVAGCLEANLRQESGVANLTLNKQRIENEDRPPPPTVQWLVETNLYKVKPNDIEVQLKQYKGKLRKRSVDEPSDPAVFRVGHVGNGLRRLILKGSTHAVDTAVPVERVVVHGSFPGTGGIHRHSSRHVPSTIDKRYRFI